MQMLVKTEAAGGISKSAQISHVDLQTDLSESPNGCRTKVCGGTVSSPEPLKNH